jgi:hypothetical protein
MDKPKNKSELVDGILQEVETHLNCSIPFNTVKVRLALQPWFVLLGTCDEHHAEVVVATANDYETLYTAHRSKTGQTLKFPIMTKYPGMQN